MSTRITLEGILILLMILANGLLAMAEIAIVSARKTRLRARSEAGHRGAAAALELAENPDDFLATVQVGITLVGILAGVFGGATISEELGGYFNGVRWIAPHGDEVALTLVVLAITYLTLVIGELVPKRIALTNPEAIGARMAPFIRAVSRVGRPAVAFLSLSSSAIVRLLRIRESHEPPVTEDDLTSMLAVGRKSGEFHPAEEQMIKGVFALGDRTARAVMTPRHEVVWLDLNLPREVLQEKIVSSGLSRFPAAAGGLDHFLGIVDVKDLIARCFAGDPVDFAKVVSEPLVFHKTTSALQVLHAFQQRKTDIGIVVDEYGGFEGVVTVSDLATRVLGLEEDEDTLVRRGDASWSVDAMMNFDDFAKEVGMRLRPDGEYDTVAGFMIEHLGRIPRIADRLEIGGYLFEVVAMDGRRVDRLLVSRSVTPTESSRNSGDSPA